MPLSPLAASSQLLIAAFELKQHSIDELFNLGILALRGRLILSVLVGLKGSRGMDQI
jgi:hypothetical protein